MVLSELMVHLCCGPCGTVAWPELIAEGFLTTGYFYGANIHPFDEWLKRNQAVRLLARSLARPVVIGPYDPGQWLSATQLLGDQPEGGLRCHQCFRLQLEGAAREAWSLGIPRLCTSLTLSPHKDPELINAIGREAADRYGLIWEDRLWRRRNGVLRSVQESRRLGMYRQNYCGCIFSLRDRFSPAVPSGFDHDRPGCLSA